MIVRSSSSLSIHSDTRTAANITSLLGIEPTESGEIGEQRRSNLDVSKLEPRYQTRESSFWGLDADESLIDLTDESGFASLRVLVGALSGKEAALAELRGDCRTTIWWSGFSDSAQSGFVIPADLLVSLGALGCDLYGTSYLTGDDDGDMA